MALITKHLMPFIRVINKLDMKDEIKKLYFNKVDVTGKTREEKEAIQQEKGMDLIFTILEKAPNAEHELYSFLALYSGKSKEDIMEAEISETIGILKEIIQDKNFEAFFQQAAK